MESLKIPNANPFHRVGFLLVYRLTFPEDIGHHKTYHNLCQKRYMFVSYNSK